MRLAVDLLRIGGQLAVMALGVLLAPVFWLWFRVGRAWPACGAKAPRANWPVGCSLSRWHPGAHGDIYGTRWTR